MNEKYGLEQVSVRMIREATLLSDEKIQNPQDAIRILGDVFKDYDREVVGVVHLRSDNVPINMTMDLYYEKIKTLMNNYQDLILENQMVLDELEQECQEKINENMAYALQYMDAYDYRMNLGKLKKEVNNIILIYGLCDMVNRAMTLVKYFTPNFGTEYYDVLYGCFCRHRKMTDMEIMLELGMSRASFYRKKKAALRYMGYYFFEIVVPQSANKRYKPSFPETEE